MGYHSASTTLRNMEGDHKHAGTARTQRACSTAFEDVLHDEMLKQSAAAARVMSSLDQGRIARHPRYQAKHQLRSLGRPPEGQHEHSRQAREEEESHHHPIPRPLPSWRGNQCGLSATAPMPEERAANGSRS